MREVSCLVPGIENGKTMTEIAFMDVSDHYLGLDQLRLQNFCLQFLFYHVIYP